VDGEVLYLNTAVYPAGSRQPYLGIALSVAVLLLIGTVLVSLTPAEPDGFRFAVGIGYWVLCCWLIGGLFLFGIYTQKRSKRKQ